MRVKDGAYTDEQINAVIRALFLQEDADMVVAWGVFCDDPTNPKAGLESRTLKEVLPLLGEDVDPKEVKTLFKRVDTDGSGKIEYDEFKVLLKGMNPRDDFEEELRALEASKGSPVWLKLKVIV